MSKKEFTLIAAVLVLGGIYVFYFTDFFKKPAIQIMAQIRPGRFMESKKHRHREDKLIEPSIVDPVTFTFDDKYNLTMIKVVEDAEYKTNKYAHCLWHIVASSNAIPSKGIVYGMKIKGMDPEVPKTRPEPLQPNTTYRLLVEAGNIKGETVFKTRDAVHPTPQ